MIYINPSGLRDQKGFVSKINYSIIFPIPPYICLDMPTHLILVLTPLDAESPDIVKKAVSKELQKDITQISQVIYLKKSLDARQSKVVVRLEVEVYVEGEKYAQTPNVFDLKKTNSDKTCHIIGFGPAGVFAALQCLELGIKPIVTERGKAVDKRLLDISNIHKKRILNPESNYCFGEGGAGTYSDGKLYTRSTKRGDVKRVLEVLVQHGADPSILYEAHPHIGTNKLPKIIEKLRQTIIEYGGEVNFESKLTDIIIDKNQIKSIVINNKSEMPIQQLILATGHSARDIFYLLDHKKVLIEAKPFALGVRIEHPQTLIDSYMYHCEEKEEILPAASYSLVAQVKGRGVFSFCMCPGGVICPAATEDGEVVVNGWSSSARNGKFANSGMVVAINPPDWAEFNEYGPLAALEFQKSIEQKAYSYSKNLFAPAQRIEDFIQNKKSIDLPRTSYQPGIESVNLWDILPPFIAESLKEGLVEFGKKIKGYRSNEAIIVGVESRTSSPVRIPREKETFLHPSLSNLYPCGEGAGYAGGIVSAALDGIACAAAIIKNQEI
jgi:uncharacterized protein